jgi:putative endonuclease
MFTVYVIRSSKREYWYVGLTNNLQRRVLQHQEGKERTTKPYRPFTIVHTEEFPTRLEARKREIYLKSGKGKEWLKTYAGVAEWYTQGT